jgi:hypothetical protein
LQCTGTQLVENDDLTAKIEEMNVCKTSTSTVEHVTICTKCRDVNIEAINDHITMIKEQNDHIDKLNAKIVEHQLENENFKFTRSMLYNGRRPGIKDGICFQQGSQSNIKLIAPKNKLSNFVKGKAPLLSVPLGKPPYFDGEDYCMWRDKMRHHLTSLHKTIWDIVEFGAQAPQVGDEDYDSDEAAQIRHYNSQATSILHASFC